MGRVRVDMQRTSFQTAMRMAPARTCILADLATGGLTRIGVDEAGRQFARAFAPRISGNGRFVVFAATPVSPTRRQAPDAAAVPRVYLRDLTAGTTVCVSCDSPVLDAPGWVRSHRT